jgi:hypothetical protein
VRLPCTTSGRFNPRKLTDRAGAGGSPRGDGAAKVLVDGESADRRDSVQPLRALVTIHLSGLPGDAPLSRGGRATRFPRLALLRVGFTEPIGSPRSLVRSYRTVSPLPVRTRRSVIGGLLSVALSCESPRLAVSQHPALWSPDLPQHDPAMRSGLRSPGRLTVCASLPPGPRCRGRTSSR